MIDRIVLALCQARNEDPWHEALVVLRAMREPSAAMVTAAHDAGYRLEPIADVWRAMIDAEIHGVRP